MFEDTNPTVRNSTGETAEDDGKGNIIIGYNEMDDDDIRTDRNLIIGSNHSYAGSGGIVAGQDNLSGDFAAVLGGTSNAAAGDRCRGVRARQPGVWRQRGRGRWLRQPGCAQGSVVITGTSNTANGIYAAVLAGSNNDARAFSVVVAGEQGETSGQSAEFSLAWSMSPTPEQRGCGRQAKHRKLQHQRDPPAG